LVCQCPAADQPALRGLRRERAPDSGNTTGATTDLPKP
jgi:hypothetical protein